MEGDPKAAVEAVEQDRNPRNRGIGLCLSGGGFRATLFHLGAIQRLFELGIATSPDFGTVPQGEASRCPEGRLRARGTDGVAPPNDAGVFESSGADCVVR